MTEEFYYEPSESVYQHYAWVNNGKVSLCNDSDGEYEQVFANREEFQRFVDHLMIVGDEAWSNVDKTDVTATSLIQRLVEDLESWMEHSNCLPESDLLTEARLYLSLQELAQGEVKPIDQVVSSVKAQAL